MFTDALASIDAFTPAHWSIAALVAFGCGSIPFGPIVARMNGVNLRTVGSGNIGATNVSRALGWKWGVLVYLLDAVKGAAPVLLAGMMAGILGHPADEIPRADMWWWLMMPIAAVLGHMFSPFVGFKGGKGVATGSGAMLAIWPVLTGPLLVAIGLWAIMIALTRTMSIASMLAAVSIPLTVAAAAIMTTGTGTTDGELPVAHALPAIIVTAGVAALVVWKHRSNLERILKGTEPRLGSKS
jgi:glycerol-3-phosphate acyltransferase PlsY